MIDLHFELVNSGDAKLYEFVKMYVGQLYVGLEYMHLEPGETHVIEFQANARTVAPDDDVLLTTDSKEQGIIFDRTLDELLSIPDDVEEPTEQEKVVAGQPKEIREELEELKQQDIPEKRWEELEEEFEDLQGEEKEEKKKILERLREEYENITGDREDETGPHGIEASEPEDASPGEEKPDERPGRSPTETDQSERPDERSETEQGSPENGENRPQDSTGDGSDEETPERPVVRPGGREKLQEDEDEPVRPPEQPDEDEQERAPERSPEEPATEEETSEPARPAEETAETTDKEHDESGCDTDTEEPPERPAERSADAGERDTPAEGSPVRPAEGAGKTEADDGPEEQIGLEEPDGDEDAVGEQPSGGEGPRSPERSAEDAQQEDEADQEDEEPPTREDEDETWTPQEASEEDETVEEPTGSEAGAVEGSEVPEPGPEEPETESDASAPDDRVPEADVEQKVREFEKQHEAEEPEGKNVVRSVVDSIFGSSHDDDEEGADTAEPDEDDGDDGERDEEGSEGYEYEDENELPPSLQVDRVTTGVDGLDEKMQGGLVQGTMNLVTGKTGTGKTAFCANFLKGGADAGESGVYVTTEERQEDIRADIEAMFGWSFEEMEEEGLVKILSIKPIFPSKEIDNLNRLVRSYISNLLDEVMAAVDEIDAERVIIDSVSIIEMFIRDEYMARVALASLLNKLREANVTAVLTGTVPETSEGLSGGGIIEFLVDTVILLEFVPVAEEHKRTLTIRKMRRTDHRTEIFPFDITRDGIKIFDPQGGFMGT